MKTRLYLFLIGCLCLSGCLKDADLPDNSGQNSDTKWSVNPSLVLGGGPGKDGIPSVDNPEFINASNVTFLSDESLVVGIKVGNEIKAYPHLILDWHEIVNDQIGNTAYSIIYCPLTGTAMCWDRTLNGQTTEFGVSGLLYQTNIIPYDRQTDSEWSQMLMKSIHGQNRDEGVHLYQVIETKWATWKKWYPNSKVMTTETGFDRPYGSYPYGDYRTNHGRLIFPIDPVDTRLGLKERVHGLIQDSVCTVYRFSHFANGPKVVNDVLNGTPVVIVGNESENYIVSFERNIDGTTLEFEILDDGSGEEIMTDQEGNVWTVFGQAVSGPRTGQSLVDPSALIGYWMTFGSFYPNPDIYN